MYKILAKSIREYKKQSIQAPVLVSLEVLLECIIPFVIAKLVNEIKAGCEITTIIWYGAALIVMAGLSLLFGTLAGTAWLGGSLRHGLCGICEKSPQGYVWQNPGVFL